MDPQIALSYGSATWVVEKYRQFFEACRACDDNIGLHVHNYRWVEELGTWVDDSSSIEWSNHCLGTSIEAFTQAFGTAPTSLRFGNYWQSTASVDQAERGGIRYDLSIEPGVLSNKSVGGRLQSAPTPGFTKVPRVPYIPSRDDFRKPSMDPESRKICLIPITSGYLKLSYRPRDIRARIGRLLRNGVKGRLQSTPLAMLAQWEGKNSYATMLARACAVQDHPYLAIVIRSNLDRNRQARIAPCVDALLEFCETRQLRFCTPAEAIETLSAATDNAILATVARWNTK